MIINQNIPAILRTFLNLQKKLSKTLHQQKQPPEVFNKLRCSQKFRKFHRKTPEACNFIKKDALAQMSSCEICEIFKNTFFINTFERLLLTSLKLPQLLLLNFLAKFITERKFLMNTFIFVRRKYL